MRHLRTRGSSVQCWKLKFPSGILPRRLSHLNIHLGDHFKYPALAFYLSLWKQGQVADLCGSEEHSRGVGASCNAGTATDASSRVERTASLVFFYRNRVSVLCLSSIYAYISPRLYNPVEGRAVYHQVFNDRECFCAERLDYNSISVVIVAHV